MKALLITLAALTLGLVALPASSQTTCGPTQRVEEVLEEKYKEQMLFQGLVNDAELFQVWFNATTGTWSLIIVSIQGTSCIIGSGVEGGIYPPIPVGKSI